MVHTRIRFVLLFASLGLLLAVLPGGASSGDLFDVSFDTNKPLGLHLDDDLKVVGFRRERIGDMTLAEKSGWIQVGDRLVGVNGVSLAGKRLVEAAPRIMKASLPKTLQFRARNGEDRIAVMEAYLGGAGNLTGATGMLEASLDGLPAGETPFVAALFGTNFSCVRTRVAWGHPSSGCTEFNNEEELMNAFVLVNRGDCAFSDKAMNVQTSGGYGMVVVNDNSGLPFRMPKADYEKGSINIPAVMVGEEAAVMFDNAFRAHHHGDILARIVFDGQSCDTVDHRAAAAAAAGPTPEEIAAEKAAHQRAQDLANAVEVNAKGEVEQLLDATAWPADERSRKKLYFRLSRIHHPDKPTGSEERFELLNKAYAMANEVYSSMAR